MVQHQMSMNSSSTVTQAVKTPYFTDFNTQKNYESAKEETSPAPLLGLLPGVAGVFATATITTAATAPYLSAMLALVAAVAAVLSVRSFLLHIERLLFNAALRKKLNAENQKKIARWLDEGGVSLTSKEAAYMSRMTSMEKIENSEIKNNFFISMVNDAGTQDMIVQKNGPYTLYLYPTRQSADVVERSDEPSAKAATVAQQEAVLSEREKNDLLQKKRMETVALNYAKNFPDSAAVNKRHKVFKRDDDDYYFTYFVDKWELAKRKTKTPLADIYAYFTAFLLPASVIYAFVNPAAWLAPVVVATILTVASVFKASAFKENRQLTSNIHSSNITELLYWLNRENGLTFSHEEVDRLTENMTLDVFSMKPVEDAEVITLTSLTEGVVTLMKSVDGSFYVKKHENVDVRVEDTEDMVMVNGLLPYVMVLDEVN